MSYPLRFSVVGLLILAAFFSGCASAPKKIQMPYALPAAPAVAATATPEAEVTAISDKRQDRSIDAYLEESPVELLRKALAAELQAGGAFASVTAQAAQPAAPLTIEVELRDLSWAVPNHKAMIQTAFWTSFLTGGLGGLAYGSTDTPVFGHAALVLKITDRATGKVLFNETLDVVHEEKMAKLKCDTPTTKAKVMAAALKAALIKGTAGVKKAREVTPATTPTPTA